MIERLADKYGEAARVVGLMQNGSVMEIYSNSELGTWTAVVSTPAGISCVVASGVAFAELTGADPVKGEAL